MSSQRFLYGGAIICNIPLSFVDISTFRDVPDYQEVYADPNTGSCIIIELLEYEENIKDNEICEYHFKKLAKDNQCCKDDILIIEKNKVIQSFINYPCYLLYGTQEISKFKTNDNNKNNVIIFLSVIRLNDEKKTDIIISISIPSSSYQSYEQIDTTEAEKIMKEIHNTFKIVDWNLFIIDR